MPSNDLSIYSRFADDWWRPESPIFKSLHSISPFRLNLIKESCGELKGKSVLDLGCGGGLLSVPLIDIGASVTGIDLSAPSILAAKRAAAGRGRFMVGDIRCLALTDQTADLIILADVLDHIAEYPRVLQQCYRLLRPGGTLFVGTINRTPISWFLAIVLGEGLRLIPPGTHDYKLFITPNELFTAAEGAGFRWRRTQGEWPNIFSSLWHGAVRFNKSRNTTVAYTMVFDKPVSGLSSAAAAS